VEALEVVKTNVDLYSLDSNGKSRRRNGVNELETGKHLQEEEIGGGTSLYQNEQGEYED